MTLWKEGVGGLPIRHLTEGRKRADLLDRCLKSLRFRRQRGHKASFGIVTLNPRFFNRRKPEERSNGRRFHK